MRESHFGFEYGAADPRPVRVLWFSMLGTQVIGAAWWLTSHLAEPFWQSVGIGAFLSAFPGFLVGLVAQYRFAPSALQQTSGLVRRIGLVALFLTVLAIAHLRGLLSWVG